MVSYTKYLSDLMVLKLVKEEWRKEEERGSKYDSIALIVEISYMFGWLCAWLWNLVISILVVIICDIVMKFCLLAWELNGLMFNWVKSWRNSMLPLLEILALVGKYRECMWLMKWKITMLEWIKLTLDEVLKTKIKEELIPHWMLK